MKKYILLLLIAFLSVHLLAQDKNLALFINLFNPVIPGVTFLGFALYSVAVVWEMWVRLQIRT